MKPLLEEIARLREREQRIIEVTSMLTAQIELSELLEKIVASLRSVTSSDAGSLYIIENNDTLRFSVAQNHSREIPFKSFTFPISAASIAGYVALSGETLRIDDVYRIDADRPYHFNKTAVDEKYGYRTKSMLVVPMRNRKNQVVGVVQLINKKADSETTLTDECTAEENVLPYTDEDAHFLDMLSSQAGIALERAALYEGIERLLRGMVESSTESIQSRVKTTAGHSQRIAAYMVAFCKRVNKETDGFWKNIKFSPVEIRELFIAAMLHDIGKIGVREHVLTKANKLTDNRMEIIRLRIEIESMHDPSKREEWQEIWKFLQEVNIPSFLDDARLARLQELGSRSVRDSAENPRPLLEPFELENLAVRKGNLTEAERKEIESHVTHSLEILKKIPWTDDLKRVPIIAGTHHEKPSGKGYPRGLKGEEIPFEGRMLAVCDVFEALTAMDRPYKRAMPIPKAIEILETEAKFGGLQPELVRFFVDHTVYDVITDELRKNFTMTSDEILALQ